DIIQGLQQVYTYASSYTIASANMSLGGGSYTSNCDSADAATKTAIDNLRSIKIATVIASGNESKTNAISSPGCISTAISVGSTRDGSLGTTADTVSSFSNSASFLNLLAPGEYIYSSIPGGAFANYRGTSMAAPHVAGAWAVVKSKLPTASVDQVLNALATTGASITDSRNGIVKPRIRVDAALNTFSGLAPTVTPTVNGTGVGAGTYDDNDSRIGYSTGWTAYTWYQLYNGTQHYSTTPGSSAQLIFTGTQVSVVHTQASSYGVLNVMIDGALVGTIVETGSLQWQVQWNGPGLANGTHTLTLVHASGSTVDIDAIIVNGATASATATSTSGSGGGAIAGCPVFPADNAWNRDVSNDPVDANSAAYIARINENAQYLHADFGASAAYGIPYIVVPGSQAKVPITFTEYASESDAGPYPVPANAPIEAGSDAHVLVVNSGECKLYEMYHASKDPNSSGWFAGSGAVFDLRSNALRPEGWTSADAAGLAIFPGLARYDEVTAGEIKHALRFTVYRSQRAYIHPATHFASSITDPSYPPMGMRVRLKASYNISSFTGQSRVVLNALKKYGMMVADNGSSWFISGATDSRWNDNDLNQLKTVPGNMFEVVQLGQIYK
ncbi:MAG: S8 family serine peptidase, partial [Chloroflexi bacterium]|nr:S8 family serine peptidase [Chloroflexota bacterium]